MSKRGEMAILKIEVELEEVTIVLWNSFYTKHPIQRMKKEDILGRFVFVFGDRNKDDRGNDQIQLGQPDQDKFEIID
jgi:hypothetical protein